MTRGGRIANSNEKSNCGGHCGSFFYAEWRNSTAIVRLHFSPWKGQMPSPNGAGEAPPHARDRSRGVFEAPIRRFPRLFRSPARGLNRFPGLSIAQIVVEEEDAEH